MPTFSFTPEYDVDRDDYVREIASAQADTTMRDMLAIPGVLKAVLAHIPEDWEYAETVHGDNPTTFAMAYAWLHDQWSKDVERRVPPRP
jgi:hypothetical protein